MLADSDSDQNDLIERPKMGSGDSTRRNGVAKCRGSGVCGRLVCIVVRGDMGFDADRIENGDGGYSRVFFWPLTTLGYEMAGREGRYGFVRVLGNVFERFMPG